MSLSVPTFPNPSDTIPEAEYLDHCFWMIPKNVAIRLCTPYGLPRHGYFRVISFQGHYAEIHRTPHMGEMVWSIMMSSRKLEPRKES